MKVPLLDLQPQYEPLRERLLAAIARVCDSQGFILGPEVEAVERELAMLLSVEHVVGVSSGTDALVASLMALGVGSGDEVITSTYSFFATAGAIAHVGARPVFVDIEPRSFGLDLERVVAAISSRTRAIIPVHLFGQSADLNGLDEVVSTHHLHIVEDAAQAHGHDSGWNIG